MNRTTWIGIGSVLLIAILVAAYYLRKMKSQWIWPVQGRLTSPFGDRIHPVNGTASFHNGIDIAAPIGTSVVAPLNGEVLSVYENSAGGKQLIIQHPNGYRSGYAHLNRILVRVGEEVMRGEVIAEVGNTGTSTGPHLHFTLTNSAGTKVDPQTYLA